MRMCTSSQVGGAAVVHGEADVPDHHDQQVQEETGGAAGLPEDVSGDTQRVTQIQIDVNHVNGYVSVTMYHFVMLLYGSSQGLARWTYVGVFKALCVCVLVLRSRTLKDLNDVQLSKIIDSMEEVRTLSGYVLQPFEPFETD